MSQGKQELIDELFHEDFQFQITTIPVPLKGREAMHQFVTGLRTSFPDLEFTGEHFIAEGDKVLGRWSIQGTSTAPFLGIPPNGAKITDHGNDIFHFKDGKIHRIWVNEDSLGLMRQLGAIPG
jgi:steroid delta-isomerase-like uncharacterized protein